MRKYKTSEIENLEEIQFEFSENCVFVDITEVANFTFVYNDTVSLSP